MTLYNVGTSRSTQLVAAGDGPTLIINRDPNNQLFISTDNGVSSRLNQSSDISIVDPLGSRTVGGLTDIWGINAGTGSIVVDVQQDALNWSASPAQIAAQIAASGIFINTNSTQIVNNTATPVALAANTQSSLPIVSFTQVGYEIRISAHWTTAPIDDLRFAIRLDWSDSASGTIVATDEWYVGASAPASTPLIIIGSGPTKGNQLTVTFNNADPIGGGNISASAVVLVNSRTYLDDEWFWQNTNLVTFTNYLSASGVVATNILGDIRANIPGNTENRYVCGLFVGRISFQWFETKIQPYGAVVYKLFQSGAVTGPIFSPLYQHDPYGYIETIAPRYPISFSIHNTTAGASTSEAQVMGLGIS